MKMFRRRKGAGEWVSRYRRRLMSLEPNTGSARGAVARVHDGGATPFFAHATSVIAAT